MLVVDDEPAITELIELLLTEEGFKVVTAQNGSEALRQCGHLIPDLIITDISMPDMEGIELVRTLRKRAKTIPIVVMSGNTVGAKFLETALLFGARATVRKPFSKQELVDAVKSCLGE